MSRGKANKTLVKRVHSPRNPIKFELPTNLGNDGFRVTSRDGMHLITPGAIKWTWDKDELWLRSMVVDDNGHVISAGMKKFFNYGENPADTARLNSAMKHSRKIFYTEKMDGSLAIRSVIGGHVFWRTRGSIDESSEYTVAIKALAKKYPKLADPTFMPEYSLHFEYCSLMHKVIVRYKEPKLVLLGGVRNFDLELLSWPEIETLGQEIHIEIPTAHQLDIDKPKELVELIKNRQEGEGIVARLEDHTWVKMKSAAYLAAHAFRFQFTPKKVVEFCRLHDVASKDDYRKVIQDEGFDWEIVEDSLPAFNEYLKTKAEIDVVWAKGKELMEEVLLEVTPKGHKFQVPPAKDPLVSPLFAEVVKTRYPKMAALCFAHLSGRAEKSRDRLETRMYKEAIVRCKEHAYSDPNLIED